jgi:hypothetical protein
MVGVDERRNVLVAQLFQGAIRSKDVVGVYIGDRLGLCERRTRSRPLTARMLAAEVTSGVRLGKGDVQ